MMLYDGNGRKVTCIQLPVAITAQDTKKPEYTPEAVAPTKSSIGNPGNRT